MPTPMHCEYCGRVESGPPDTPAGWFGVDEDGNKICDGCRIKKFRKDHRLSQRQLAQKLGVNIRSIQRWESGDRTPHPMTLRLIEHL